MFHLLDKTGNAKVCTRDVQENVNDSDQKLCPTVQ